MVLQLYIREDLVTEMVASCDTSMLQAIRGRIIKISRYWNKMVLRLDIELRGSKDVCEFAVFKNANVEPLITH